MHKFINDIFSPNKICCVWVLVLLSFAVNAQEIASLNQLFSNNINNTGSFHFHYSLDGKTLMDKSYSSGSKNVGKNTAIKISSASESIVSAVVLSLWDEGLLKLDDPVSKFLPQFRGEMSKITILQLLSHTSGLPSNSIYLHDENLNLKFSVNNIAKNLSINTPPGTEFSYGAVGYQILGRVAEIVSEDTWENIIARKITQPCGMSNTYYRKGKSINVAEDIVSTAADFEQFLSMLLNKGQLNGKQVLSERAINEMISDQTSKYPVGYAPYRYQKEGFSGYYGLGVWIDRLKEDGTVTEISTQGAKGFTAWVNFCNKSKGMFAIYGDLKYSQPVIGATRSYLTENYATACKDISSKALSKKLKNSKGATYTNITFELYREANVNLRLYDPLGNELQELIDGDLKKGNYNFPVDISELSSGVYFYRLKIDDKVETKKLTIRK
ncbi:MAG: serine hydrolase [Chitinophagales bacterium]